MKNWICGILLLTTALQLLSGCGQTQKKADGSPVAGSSSSAGASIARTKAETRTFVDSAGREVSLPVPVQRIVPAGPGAQLLLYALCPDELASLAEPYTEAQKPFILENIADKPVSGILSAGDLESGGGALKEINPDMIVETGAVTEATRGDMDLLQKDTKVPVVFLKTTLDSLTNTCDLLGELTGETGQTETISEYIKETLHQAAEKRAYISKAERLSVCCVREAGGTGSAHSAEELLDRVGATADAPGAAGGSKPDAVLFISRNAYSFASGGSERKIVEAVRNGRYSIAPDTPYSWIESPLSVNRLLGVRWLGRLLYPNLYSYDMTGEVMRFYRLFYHCDISREMAEQMLKNSMGKAR